jgi:hypothetical protein
MKNKFIHVLAFYTPYDGNFRGAIGALVAGGLGKVPHRAVISLICFITEALAMTLVPFLDNVIAVACAMLIARYSIASAMSQALL